MTVTQTRPTFDYWTISVPLSWKQQQALQIAANYSRCCEFPVYSVWILSLRLREGLANGKSDRNAKKTDFPIIHSINIYEVFAFIGGKPIIT